MVWYDKLSANSLSSFNLPKSPAVLDRARIGDMLVFDKEPP